MFESLFDVSLIIAGPAIILLLCLFAISGLHLVRRHVLPRLRIHHEDSHFSGAMVHSVMVFYGLAVALIAVNVFETYADVSKITSHVWHRFAERDVARNPCGRHHQPKRFFLFQGRRCALARDSSDPSGYVHWAGDLHDPCPRPPIPRGPWSKT